MATKLEIPELPTDGNRNEMNTDSVCSKYDGVFKTNAVYGKEGKSFGNKLLISLPILNIAIPLVFLVASYIYATERHDVFLPNGNSVPFISDIGDKRPQSSLFTFGLALSSYATLGVVIIRFWQIKHFLLKCDKRMNNTALVVGLIFILGKLIVVSFQLSSEKAVHFLGAGIYVIFATIYAILQTLISFKNRTLYGRHQKYIITTRIILVAGMCIGTIIFGIFLIPSLTKYNRKGYSIGQSAEWLFACAKTFYLLTFVVDFWPVHPKLLLIKSKSYHFNDVVIPNESNVLRISYQKYVNNGQKGEEMTTIQEQA